MEWRDYDQFFGVKLFFTDLVTNVKAVSVSPNTTLIYNFESAETDSLKIIVALAPNQPVDGKTFVLQFL
jgi:hypothetical protein